MTIKQALGWAQNKLNKSKIDSAGLDTEVLLIANLYKSKRESVQIDRSFLYTHPEYELANRQVKKYKEDIKRRATGEPVAYIVGHREFYGHKFLVNKNVLIPRPETEEIVETIINKQSTISKDNKLTIIDVGTGSGCIIISTIKSLTTGCACLPVRQGLSVTGYATDICKKALGVAKKNAKLHKVENKITFLQGNLLEPIIYKQSNNEAIKQWNNVILVANLPYVPDGEIDNNQPNARGLKFEPKKALYAGKDGLDLYREFFEQAKKLKYKPKYIFCEIGDGQVKSFKYLVKKNLPKIKKIEIKKDLAGKNRVAIIKV